MTEKIATVGPACSKSPMTHASGTASRANMPPTRSPTWPAMNARSSARLHYLCDSGHLVLEFGCGTGTTALKLAPFARAHCRDGYFQRDDRDRARRAAQGCRNAAFEVGTPDRAPRSDGTFDVVLGFNVLHLVEARAAALQGVHRLLKPGGLFISKTPCLKDMGIGMGLAVRLAVPLMQAVGKGAVCDVFLGGRTGARDRGGGVCDRRAGPARVARQGRAAVPGGAKSVTGRFLSLPFGGGWRAEAAGRVGCLMTPPPGSLRSPTLPRKRGREKKGLH